MKRTDRQCDAVTVASEISSMAASDILASARLWGSSSKFVAGRLGSKRKLATRSWPAV